MSERVQLRADALEWRNVEGEIVALDLDRSLYLAINRVGTTLWPALVEGATQDELARQLSEAFGIDTETAARDVERFVADLAERGLLQR